MNDNKVVVELLLQNNQYLAQLKASQDAMSKFAQKSKQTGSFDFSRLIPSVAIIGTLVAAFHKVSEETIEAQKAAAQLDAVIKSTGGAAGVTSQMAKELADKLSDLSSVDDDVIIGAEAIILQFTNIKDDVFPGATEAALNLSARLGTDLNSAAMKIGKALQDPINGMKSLKKLTGEFSAEQQKQIKQFMAVNDVASAQKVILEKLEKAFGGAAEAQGNTFEGSMKRMNNALGDISKTIGNELSPGLKALAYAFQNASKNGGFFQLVGQGINKMLEGMAMGVTLVGHVLGSGKEDRLAAEEKAAQLDLQARMMDAARQGYRDSSGKSLAERKKDPVYQKMMQEMMKARIDASQAAIDAENSTIGAKMARVHEMSTGSVAKVDSQGNKTGYEMGANDALEKARQKMEEDFKRFEKAYADFIAKDEFDKKIADNGAAFAELLRQAEEFEKAGLLTHEQYLKKRAELDAAYKQKLEESENARLAKQVEHAIQFIDMASSSLTKVNSMLDMEDQGKIGKMQKTYDIRRKIVDATIQDEQKKAAALQIIDAQEQMRKRQIERAAFERKKAVDIAETIMSGAKGALQAFVTMLTVPIMGPILGGIQMGLTAALTAGQVAVIARQQYPAFAQGVVNVPNDQLAVVHRGEDILPKSMAEEIRRGNAVYGPAQGDSSRVINLILDGKILASVVDDHRSRKAASMGAMNYAYAGVYR